MRSPLIQRLFEDYGYPEIDQENLEAFLQGPGVHVLFFTGDPKQHRETNDVAVVLPELVKAFPGQLNPGVVSREAEKALRVQYGFRRWPALVFLRRKGYLGAITGIRIWADYLTEVRALLASEPKQPPSFDTPVAAES